MSALSVDLATARALEERALNASGAIHSLLYDGWLLGFRTGPTKRLRCVNPFYASTLPLAHKVEHCMNFYREVSLPAIFRMLPFSQPPDLDAWLDHAGWPRFDCTKVLHVDLASARVPAAPPDPVEVMDVAAWQEPVAELMKSRRIWSPSSSSAPVRIRFRRAARWCAAMGELSPVAWSRSTRVTPAFSPCTPRKGCAARGSASAIVSALLTEARRQRRPPRLSAGDRR